MEDFMENRVFEFGFKGGGDLGGEMIFVKEILWGSMSKF